MKGNMRPLKVDSKTIRKIKAWNKVIEKSGQYFPFVRVKDVRSPGRRYEHYCPKQKRIVHLLSDGEFRTYIKLIWSPTVIKVNEQVPLDLNETMRIATEQNVVHPRDYKKNHAHVMTTDLVVTELDIATGELKDTAYSFKYYKSIHKIVDGKQTKHKKRTWQKLDIEKRYWESRNIEYKILTETFATKTEIHNIHLCLSEYHKSVDKALLISLTEQFISIWSERPKLSLENILSEIASDLCISSAEAFTIFKKATLSRLIPLDLAKQKLMLYKKVFLI